MQSQLVLRLRNFLYAQTRSTSAARAVVDRAKIEPASCKTLGSRRIPRARRVLGESDWLTLRMRWDYTKSLVRDTSATLDDLREAVTTLEDARPTARCVLGGAHPTTEGIERILRDARAALRAHDTPPGSS